MKRVKSRLSSFFQIRDYLKDYRFSSIFIKYFLLLFICLVLPVSILSSWYGNRMQENMYQEMIQRNEASLELLRDNVNEVLLSMQNLAYQLGNSKEADYLATRSDIRLDGTGNADNLRSAMSIIKVANSYIDSMCLYFAESNMVVSANGTIPYEEYGDKAGLALLSENMPSRTVFQTREKNGKYPYLLTILYPISNLKHHTIGAAVVNIDVENLGEYIGSGRYRNTDYSPMLLIFDGQMENLIYSDEYRLLRDDNVAQSLGLNVNWEKRISEVCVIDGISYIMSGVYSEKDGFRYVYLTCMEQLNMQNQTLSRHLRSVTILLGVLSFLIAFLLSIWVYQPIQRTIQVLKHVSMLTQWDRKEQVNEIEAIQRSILSAKKENEDLNDQIQERIIGLHNAQICALQTQINPHFLYNTLEAIGNAAALLMNGNNQITEMIYTLGRLMRISLSGENYLVSLEEELEHVNLYVKLVDFRFKDRIRLYIDVPGDLKKEKIVKLTLQPLIENAIEHGLGRKRADGVICIKGEKLGDANFLYVTDNGDGISEATLTRLREQMEESAIQAGGHIGLRNVNQRLKLVFGEEYGLSVDKVDEGGFCVTIRYKTI